MNFDLAPFRHRPCKSHRDLGVALRDLPQRTRDVVRNAILDTAGGIARLHHAVGADLARLDTRRRRRRGAAAWGDATVAARGRRGDGQRHRAHSFEMTTTTTPSCIRARVVPAALAVGEKLDADGARILTAIAAGYEV